MIKSRPIYQALRLDPAGRAHLMVTDLAAVPDDVLTALGPATEIWTSQAGVEALVARLDTETVGLRLYAVGTEAFLWDVHNAALAAGLGKGEVFLAHAGSKNRRVYCTHCKTMHEAVSKSIFKCSHCGVHLLVRDHFSRRLAAFMGVIVDAEVPGELPVAEVLYP